MYRFFAVILMAQIVFTMTCPEPQTMIHIQNYEGPIYVAPGKALISTKTCDNSLLDTKICDNPSIISHKSACDSDCKCTAKILPNANIIPINTVSQGACYYPYDQEGYSYQGYSHGNLVPLLKTLTQQGCHKCCKCGKTYSSYQ